MVRVAGRKAGGPYSFSKGITILKENELKKHKEADVFTTLHWCTFYVTNGQEFTLRDFILDSVV